MRFEVTTNPLIGSLASVRDFKQAISERGLLFLCFSELKLFATRSVLQSNTVKENGKYAFTHLKVELCIFGALAVHGSIFTFTG